MPVQYTPTPWRQARNVLFGPTAPRLTAHTILHRDNRTPATRAVLVDELTKAHAIIAVMLTNMTLAGKRKADATLTAAGICPTGMTRRDERQAVLDQARATGPV